METFYQRGSDDSAGRRCCQWTWSWACCQRWGTHRRRTSEEGSVGWLKDYGPKPRRKGEGEGQCGFDLHFPKGRHWCWLIFMLFAVLRLRCGSWCTLGTNPIQRHKLQRVPLVPWVVFSVCWFYLLMSRNAEFSWMLFKMCFFHWLDLWGRMQGSIIKSSPKMSQLCLCGFEELYSCNFVTQFLDPHQVNLCACYPMSTQLHSFFLQDLDCSVQIDHLKN